jgi:SAM-dependent methyltransferase
MKRSLLILFLSIALAQWQACASEATSWRKGPLDVIYEPTGYPIVEEMLNLAGVSSEDVVYDLGCGDGRIVITAAKLRGARGVGVDLDPVRVKESLRNAESEGVTDKVLFYEQNLFDADLAEATVVMLYLFPHVNLKLRPKLLRELKPGTRIVSHSHSMGEWDADAVKNVQGKDLHFFVVPANVTGTWLFIEPGGEEISLTLTQKFQHVRGTMKIGSETYLLRGCSLAGSRFSFTVERNFEGVRKLLFFTGRVSGDDLEARVVREGGDHTGEAWKAVRSPSTAVSIAE